MPDGTPFHTTLCGGKAGAKGQTRAVKVKDAQKVNAYPSVTNILDVIKVPALDKWKQNLIMEGCLTTEREEGEAFNKYIKRIESEIDAAAMMSAKFGTGCHKVLEDFMRNGHVDTTDPHYTYVHGVVQWLQENVYDITSVEETVVNRESCYAGTADLVAEVKGVGQAVIDYKTKKPGWNGLGVYRKWGRQLAAYREALQAPHCPPMGMINIVINSLEPAEPCVHVWNPTERVLFQEFQDIYKVWKLENQYEPIPTNV